MGAKLQVFFTWETIRPSPQPAHQPSHLSTQAATMSAALHVPPPPQADSLQDAYLPRLPKPDLPTCKGNLVTGCWWGPPRLTAAQHQRQWAWPQQQKVHSWACVLVLVRCRCTVKGKGKGARVGKPTCSTRVSYARLSDCKSPR